MSWGHGSCTMGGWGQGSVLEFPVDGPTDTAENITFATPLVGRKNGFMLSYFGGRGIRETLPLENLKWDFLLFSVLIH